MAGKKKSRYMIMKALEKVDRLLKDGGEVFTSLSDFQKDPTPAGAVTVGLKLGRKILGTKFFDSFRPDSWEIYSPGEDQMDTLVEILHHLPHQKQGDKKENLITFFDLGGITLAYQKSYMYFMFPGSEATREEVHERLAEIVWEHCGSPLTMRSKSNKNQNSWVSTVFEYAPAKANPLLGSQLSSDIVKRLQKFLDRGLSRSAIFYGPPGTGKSTIINNIAALIGKRVLTVDVADMHYCSATVLTKRVSWLKPDVLVINDLDRFRNSESMLTSLEELHSVLDLLLVSVNDLDNLPAAVRRPGRFDELFEVKQLDERVVLSLIKVRRDLIPDYIYNELLTWPAAFIAELGRVIDVLGIGSLVEEFSKLQERVKLNSPEEDEDEDEDEDDDSPAPSKKKSKEIKKVKTK